VSGHPAVEREQAVLLPRFGVSERVAHWLLAAAFASMLASGARMGGIGPLDHHVLLFVHVGSAVVLVAGIAALMTTRLGRRPLVQTAHDLGALSATDRRWLRLAPRAYLAGGKLPPAGRFNAGQKVNARLVLLVMLALYVSGLAALHRYTSIVDPIRVLGGFHGLAAGAATVLVAGHVYLAVLHPATRHALRGITLGTVRRGWAEDHHADWVASLDADGDVRGRNQH
jgi:formate dehydrogenase subunit gamma